MSTVLMRRGYAADWTAKNTVLQLGEQGFERDTGKFKVGDGQTPWTELPYFTPSSGGGGVPPSDVDLTNHINSPTPHPVYDDGPSLVLLYENAKV